MDHLPLVHTKDAVLAKGIFLREKMKFHHKNLSANVRITSLCLFKSVAKPMYSHYGFCFTVVIIR